MNEILLNLKERLSDFSISALFPSLQYILSEGWNAQDGFADEKSKEFFEQLVSTAAKFVERGDKTGIPHYILFWGATIGGCDAEREADEELQGYCLNLADKYIREAIDLGFNLAYYELGYQLFRGSGIWDRDEEVGIELMEKAIALSTPAELGVEPEFITDIIKSGYDECFAVYSPKSHTERETANRNDSAVMTEKKDNLKIQKEFTAKYYLACLAAFVGYILVSIIVRNEFGLKSAYDISLFNNPLLGIGATLVLNYSIIPLLMMAYFYKRNNGKHSAILVGLYIIFLILCYADGVVPYAKTSTNLLNLLLYPTIFLVAHRLLSLLIYVIISGKEGQSDYKIYFGISLFVPFMAWILLIGIVFWIIQAAGGEAGPSQPSEERRSANLKDSVREELSLGVRSAGVYYDDGWKVVDYWNNCSSLSEIEGSEWGHTYLQDSNGKVYDLSTNSPDKDTVYYFN